MPTESISILLLFSSSDIGGAERSLTRMATINKNPSVSYHIATFGAEGSLSKWIKDMSIECHCFNYQTLSLIKYIYMNKPDVIYVIGFRLSIFLRFFCKIFLKNLIFQGVRWNPSSQSKLDKVFRFFENHFSFLLDGYIVNSKAAAKTIRSVTRKKVEVIYNGISVLPKNEFNQTKNKYVITAATLSPRKGHKEYIRVISNIVEQFPNSQFLFLGNDNLNGEIQKLIESADLSRNVKYLGFMVNVEEFLDQSIIFVLPSLYGEGCPTSILEAFSYKLPVVAYDIDGIPELVTHNVDGILANFNETDSLENAIKELLLNPTKAKKMGEKGYDKVHKKFLFNNMLDKHNSFFLGFK